MVASKKVEFEVKEPIKQKRYRKRNLKKITSVYRGVTKKDGNNMIGQHVPLAVTITYSRRMTNFLDGLAIIII